MKSVNQSYPEMRFDPGFVADAELVLTLTCSACSETRLVKLTCRSGQAFPPIHFPKGWRTVDGNPVCDRHSISVR